MLYQTHDKFDKEIKKLTKSYRTTYDSLEDAKRLLKVQFHPTDPRAIIGPGKIHRVTSNQTWEIWKLEVAMKKSGLRPNQWPRVWFAISGDTITFLVASTHVNNYSDGQCDKFALDRYTEIA